MFQIQSSLKTILPLDMHTIEREERVVIYTIKCDTIVTNWACCVFVVSLLYGLWAATVAVVSFFIRIAVCVCSQCYETHITIIQFQASVKLTTCVALASIFINVKTLKYDLCVQYLMPSDDSTSTIQPCW